MRSAAAGGCFSVAASFVVIPGEVMVMDWLSSFLTNWSLGITVVAISHTEFHVSPFICGCNNLPFPGFLLVNFAQN